MTARNVNGKNRVTVRVQRSALFWLLLSAMGCAPTTQDYELDAMGEVDGGVEGASDLAEKSTSVIYQAESRTDEDGCVVAKNYGGYTGNGFVDYGVKGTWIEWNNVKVSAAGESSLAVRYANASEGGRPADIIVNGSKVGNLAFASTGSWSNWKTASVKARLRSGSNVIRIVASSSAGGPNIDSMSVSGGGSGSVRDLEFVHYANLPRNEQLHTFTNVTADYIVYDESNGRMHHNENVKVMPGFVGMRGATLVDAGGGRDKYIALFKVNSSTVVIDLDQGQNDDDGGAGHAIFIKTRRTLAVTEARSIDPDVKKESVPSPRSDEVMIYAEDEGKYDERYEAFKPKSAAFFGKKGNDDVVYVFAQSLGTTPNGNGAIMRLKIQ